jgi:hypothetical protein
MSEAMDENTNSSPESEILEFGHKSPEYQYCASPVLHKAQHCRANSGENALPSNIYEYS